MSNTIYYPLPQVGLLLTRPYTQAFHDEHIYNHFKIAANDDGSVLPKYNSVWKIN